MRFVVIAHRCTDTNEALAAAAEALGVAAAVLPPRDALRLLEPGDVALGRLDVREGLDGIEGGSRELERLTAAGVEVLNRPSTLVAAHDKLLTARALRLAGLPHPHTWLIAEGMPTPAPELPLVLEAALRQLGTRRRRSAARRRTSTRRSSTRRFRGWFREHGALAQELVPPLGWDLRVVVAGGRVVGAARRVAARRGVAHERLARRPQRAGRSRRRSRGRSRSRPQRRSAATSSASTCCRRTTATSSPS